MPAKRLNVIMRSESYDALKELSDITHRSVSDTVRDALRLYHAVVFAGARGARLYERMSEGAYVEVPTTFEVDESLIPDRFRQTPSFD